MHFHTTSLTFVYVNFAFFTLPFYSYPFAPLVNWETLWSQSTATKNNLFLKRESECVCIWCLCFCREGNSLSTYGCSLVFLLSLPGRQITTVVPKELTNGCRKNFPSRRDAKVRLSETRCQEVLGVCFISETNSWSLTGY